MEPEFDISYSIDPEIQKKSVLQHIGLKTGKLWPYLIIVLAACLYFLFLGDNGFIDGTLFGVFLTIALFSVLLMRLIKKQMAVAGDDHLSLQEHSDIRVTIDDKKLVYENSIAKSTLRWEIIEKITESKDFLYLSYKSIPLVTLPKEHIGQAAADYIRNRVQQGLRG